MSVDLNKLLEVEEEIGQVAAKLIDITSEVVPRDEAWGELLEAQKHVLDLYRTVTKLAEKETRRARE